MYAGVFENRVLRNLFGPKSDKVQGEWQRPYNETLHDLCSAPNIIQSIKYRRMRWAGHVAWERGEVHSGRNLKQIKVREH
jgi:hypothetical protein